MSELVRVEVAQVITQQWESLARQIRPNYMGAIEQKIAAALRAGLLDAAVNYAWTATIVVLRKMVEAYGLKYVGQQLDEEIKSMDDLARKVSDYKLVEACFALNIIGRPAYIQLHHCLNLRNHFSESSHPTDEIIDAPNAMAFLQNCVRYVLSADTPPPGFSPSELIEQLAKNPIDDVEAVRNLVAQQAPRALSALLHILFSEYVKPETAGVLKNNISLVAKTTWDGASESARQEIGERYARFAGENRQDELQAAIDFLRNVEGTGFIPISQRRRLFLRASKNLLSAHFEFNNFYNEPAHARALAEMDYQLPEGSEQEYVRAVMLVYLGNPYGVSIGAEPYAKQMLQNLSRSGVEALFELLMRDENITRELQNERPASRLAGLMQLIPEVNVATKRRKDYEFFRSAEAETIMRRFAGRFRRA